MILDIDGLAVDFSDEKLIKSIIDTCGSQVKRAFLKCHGSYSDDDLKSTQYVQGLWAGLIASQTSTGGSQAIKAAREKRLSQIETSWKTS